MLAQGADCEPLPVAVVLSLLGGGGGMASGLPGAQPRGAGEQDRRGGARDVPLRQASAQQRRTC